MAMPHVSHPSELQLKVSPRCNSPCRVSWVAQWLWDSVRASVMLLLFVTYTAFFRWYKYIVFSRLRNSDFYAALLDARGWWSPCQTGVSICVHVSPHLQTWISHRNESLNFLFLFLFLFHHQSSGSSFQLVTSRPQRHERNEVRPSWWDNRSVHVLERLCRSLCAADSFDLIGDWCHCRNPFLILFLISSSRRSLTVGAKKTRHSFVFYIHHKTRWTNRLIPSRMPTAFVTSIESYMFHPVVWHLRGYGSSHWRLLEDLL